MAKKKNSLVPAVLPAASGVHLIDARLFGRVFYRDAHPAGSVWFHPLDPKARGELVILPS